MGEFHLSNWGSRYRRQYLSYKLHWVSPLFLSLDHHLQPRSPHKEFYDFLEQYAFTPQHWLFRQDMFSYYGIDERMNWESICWSVVSGLLDKLDSPLFEKYSLGDYLKQVRSSLFREWELNEPVSEERKTLQRRYIWRLKQLAQNGKKSDCRIAIWAEMELQEILALAVKYRNTVTDKFYPESVIVGIRNCIK